MQALVYDPFANAEEVRREYGFDIIQSIDSMDNVDAIIFAVPHKRLVKEFAVEKLIGLCKKDTTPVIIDIKGVFEPSMVQNHGAKYWRLWPALINPLVAYHTYLKILKNNCKHLMKKKIDQKSHREKEYLCLGFTETHQS